MRRNDRRPAPRARRATWLRGEAEAMELFGSAVLEAEVERAVRALEALGTEEALGRAAALCRSLDAYRREATQAGKALQGASRARREVRLALACLDEAVAAGAEQQAEAREQLAARRELLRRAVAERDLAPYQHEGARLRLRAALLEAEGFVQARAEPGSQAMVELTDEVVEPRRLH